MRCILAGERRSVVVLVVSESLFIIVFIKFSFFRCKICSLGPRVATQILDAPKYRFQFILLDIKKGKKWKKITSQPPPVYSRYSTDRNATYIDYKFKVHVLPLGLLLNPSDLTHFLHHQEKREKKENLCSCEGGSG